MLPPATTSNSVQVGLEQGQGTACTPRSLSSEDAMGIGTSAEGLVVVVAVPPGCTELAASSGRKQAFLAQLLVLGIFKKFLAANFSCATSQLPERIEYDHIT